MPGIEPQEFLFLLPEMFLAAVGMTLLVAGSIGKGVNHRAIEGLSLAGLGLTAVLVFWIKGQAISGQLLLAEMFIHYNYAIFWKILFLVATALTVFLSARFVEEGRYRPSEYYSLLLLATTGMMLMVSGFTLLSIWISLELMALSSYILAGYFKREKKSNEAALKYFILGALSSGILLYGISLLYGATGTIQLAELAARLPGAQAANGMLVALGWIFLAAGLLFKVAAVPFHVWTPDVYVGAPTPVTAYLAAASKAASFAILVRIFYMGLTPLVLDWQLLVASVAVLSMVWGNLAALTQQNVKRMLAYSSIAHAGYILIGVLAVNEIGLWALMFYLLAYTLMTLGAFGTVVLLERREYAGETYADYAGLAQRAPLLAALMLIFLLGLTGIPPTGGFFGKFYLFAAAVESGWTWVAVIGVIMSAISLYYYMGVVVSMYFQDSDRTTPVPLRAPVLVGAIGFCALVTVVLGIFPGPFVELAKASLLPLP